MLVARGKGVLELGGFAVERGLQDRRVVAELGRIDLLDARTRFAGGGEVAGDELRFADGKPRIVAPGSDRGTALGMRDGGRIAAARERACEVLRALVPERLGVGDRARCPVEGIEIPGFEREPEQRDEGGGAVLVELKRAIDGSANAVIT